MLNHIVLFSSQFSILLSPQPRSHGVYPSDADAEPAEATDFLAAEAQDEVTVGIATEWQTNIDEADVVTPHGMGILDGMPESDGIRMEGGIALTSGSRIPQIGIVTRIDAGTATYDLLMDIGYEQLAVSAVHHATEENIVGDKASGLQPVVTPQQF